MHRISRKMVLALVVVGALVAGGAAYTNSITGNGTTTNTAGYDGISVSGAVLNDASYQFNNDGSQITGVTLTFQGNTLSTNGNDVVHAGFDDMTNGALTANSTCTAPAANGANDQSVCTFTTSEPTGTPTKLDVLVNNS